MRDRVVAGQLAGVIAAAWLAWMPAARADDVVDAPPAQAPPAYSPATAAWLSAGTTVVGVAAVAAVGDDTQRMVGIPLVVLLGPSVGHWYAHDVWSVGLGVRLAGAATVGWGLSRWCDPDDPPAGGCKSHREPYFIGGAMLLVGAAIDVVTAPAAARRGNRAARVTMVPVVSGDRAGVAMVGAF